MVRVSDRFTTSWVLAKRPDFRLGRVASHRHVRNTSATSVRLTHSVQTLAPQWQGESHVAGLGRCSHVFGL